jgi:HAD superfamily hydrolase (TIGR01458 family)
MAANALLLDLDGTLYEGDAPLPGALAAISSLVERKVPRRYLTNTTRISRQTLVDRLRAMGFELTLDELFTTAIAASRWLGERGIQRIALYVPDATREDFSHFDLVDERPEAIVVGDLGEGWSFARLNSAFQHLLGGATLVALQKNRSWKTPQGTILDAGPYVAALEYAAHCEATVVGKPNPAFFHLAAASLGLPPEEMVVVGDDVETDIAGAHAAGMRGALVRTGKFREETLLASGIHPDWMAENLGEFIHRWLGPGV